MRLIESFSRYAAWIAGTMLGVSAVLVAIEVVIRKAFLMSFGGVDELSGYAFAIGTSWAFSFALLKRAHVRIDVVYVLLPARVRALLDLVALVALGIFVSVLTRYAGDTFLFAFQFSTKANTPLATPLWIPQLLWLSGFVYFAATIAVQIFRTATALVTGNFERVREIAGTRATHDEIKDELVTPHHRQDTAPDPSKSSKE